MKSYSWYLLAAFSESAAALHTRHDCECRKASFGRRHCFDLSAPIFRRQALYAIVREHDDWRVCLFCALNHGLLYIQKSGLSLFRDGSVILFGAYHVLFPFGCSMNVHVDWSNTSADDPSDWAINLGGSREPSQHDH